MKCLALQIACQYGLIASLSGCDSPAANHNVGAAAPPTAKTAVAASAAEQQFGFRHDENRGIFEVVSSSSAGVVERVRILPAPKQPWTAAEHDDLVRRERLSAARRRDAAQLLNPLPPTPEARHEAWLEACARLEPAVFADPGNLGLRRDLLTALVALLSYERDSPFGSGTLRSAVGAWSELKRRAFCPDAVDLECLARSEAWLAYHQHAFPLTVEATAKITNSAERRAIEQLLAAQGQGRFNALPSWTVGMTTVKAWHTIGRSPSPELAWSEYHFLVSPTEQAAGPARIVSYTLDVRGSPGEETHYLRLHADAHATIAVPYGRRRPTYSLLKYHVSQLVNAEISSLAQVKNQGAQP